MGQGILVCILIRDIPSTLKQLFLHALTYVANRVLDETKGPQQ